MLSRWGLSVGVIEILSKRFSERYDVVAVSNRKNQFVRLADMLFTIFKHRKQTKVVIIDSYSSLAFWYLWLAAMLCRLLRLPYMPILHGGNFPARLISSPRASRMVFKNALMNVSPSKYLQETFTKAGFQVAYIPNTVDISLYPFKMRHTAKPHILWVRSFHEIYNPVMAVKVLALIKVRFPEATLCMVGGDKDGSLQVVKDAASKLGIDSSIKYAGFVKKEDWIALSKDYDLFINTTNFDNQPVSVIEAMALGFPIVSTNAGGVPYLIDDGGNGILVNKDDAEGMAQALFNIIDDATICEKLSIEARKKAESLDWNEVQHLWWNLLDKSMKV
jgi:glycosyltransferase involved in cell wall biosynthesis